MTVSIVVPVYNQEKYIDSCIKSALAQTYDDCEIIVVNDGSTDRTSEACLSYRDEIRYFEKSNGGPSSALNMGLSKMKGSWFKWLSSDDLLKPKSLETMLNKAQDTCESVIYGDWEMIDENGNTLGTSREKSFSHHEDFCIALFDGFIGNASASLIRRACFRRTGKFDERLRFGEDYLMWLKLAKHYRFVHVPQVVAAYRYHPGSLTDTNLDRLRQNSAHIRETGWRYWKKHKTSSRSSSESPTPGRRSTCDSL